MLPLRLSIRAALSSFAFALACSSNDPASNNLGAASSSVAGSGGAAAGGVSGQAAAGGGSAGSGGCACTFSNGLNGIDIARGCYRQIRQAPEVIFCGAAPEQCGGIAVGCTLVHEAEGMLEAQSFPHCPFPGSIPAGWRSPTLAEEALRSSAQACAGGSAAGGAAGSAAGGAAGSESGGAAGSESGGAAGSPGDGESGSSAGGGGAGGGGTGGSTGGTSTTGGASGGGAAGSGGAPACTPNQGLGAAGAVIVYPQLPPEGSACPIEGYELCTKPSGFGDGPTALSRCSVGKWQTVEAPSACKVALQDCNWPGAWPADDGACCTGKDESSASSGSGYGARYCAGLGFCDGVAWRK